MMIDESENIIQEPEEKKTDDGYRTRNIAENNGSTVSPLPETLALPTIKPYQQGLTTVPNSMAYLQPLVREMASTLQFKDGKLYFDSLPLSKAVDLYDYFDNSPKAVSRIDLPLLRAIYAIILQDIGDNILADLDPAAIMAKIKDPQYLGYNVRLYLPDFMRMIGMTDTSKEQQNLIVAKIMDFNTLIGVLKENINGRERFSYYQVMNFIAWEASDNSINFSSAYINRLIADIAKARIKLDKQNRPKLSNSGKPFTLPAYTYLVKADIVKERNKRAAEIVCVVTTLIEQAGDNTPHIMAKTIVDRCPDLKNALEATERSSDKTTVLKRAFSKAWQLLHTHTLLEETYKDIKLPTVVPTAATLDMVFEFPHNGKIKKRSQD